MIVSHLIVKNSKAAIHGASVANKLNTTRNAQSIYKYKPMSSLVCCHFYLTITILSHYDIIFTVSYNIERMIFKIKNMI